MALVRCPTHGIPYNDENPRGCPACFQASAGRKNQADMMRELAEASQPIDDNLEAALRGPTLLERLNDVLGDLPDASKWLSRAGPFVILVLVIVLVLVSGPSYVEQPDPIQFGGTVRPLTVRVGNTTPEVFRALGPQDPQPHDRSPAIRRYFYGTNLIVDVMNGYVYALELGLPNRSWAGLRVGMTQTEAEGELALFGPPRAFDENPGPPQIRAGRQVYASSISRPIRTLTSRVRPPSGCYDIRVELRPRQTGLLIDGDERYSVVGRENDPLQYVVTRIIVVDRRRRGPDGDAEC